MPIILPQGIVINTTNIYKEVASYPVIPADKIWEYWHGMHSATHLHLPSLNNSATGTNHFTVYTTTNKKIQDPTARRLENFWWQVWGSDRRYLSGRALAKIYEDISLGPTVVPLRGPPEALDGPLAIAAKLARELAAAQATNDAAPPAKSSDVSFRSTSSASSSSKPPPPHPILKKSRSPLASGPKPTARFASPTPESDEDDIPSSGSTAATGLEMALPSKPAHPPGKSSSQRRPRICPQQPPANQADGANERLARNTDIDGRATLSSKAAGKRPVTPLTTTTAAATTTNSGSSYTSAGLPRTDTEMQPPETAPGMRRTTSSNGGFSRKMSATSLFTGATASTTNVAARGTIIDQAGSLPTSTIALDQGLASVPSPTFPPESRMTPTPPTSAASVPMGRTRSQLTLLLERDASKNADRSRSKS